MTSPEEDEDEHKALFDPRGRSQDAPSRTNRALKEAQMLGKKAIGTSRPPN